MVILGITNESDAWLGKISHASLFVISHMMREWMCNPNTIDAAVIYLQIVRKKNDKSFPAVSPRIFQHDIRRKRRGEPE